jgi:hypothetical protein
MVFSIKAAPLCFIGSSLIFLLSEYDNKESIPVFQQSTAHHQAVNPFTVCGPQIKKAR